MEHPENKAGHQNHMEQKREDQLRTEALRLAVGAYAANRENDICKLAVDMYKFLSGNLATSDE